MILFACATLTSDQYFIFSVVLDGIGKGLDPRFDITEIARPWELSICFISFKRIASGLSRIWLLKLFIHLMFSSYFICVVMHLSCWDFAKLELKFSWRYNFSFFLFIYGKDLDNKLGLSLFCTRHDMNLIFIVNP